MSSSLFYSLQWMRRCVAHLIIRHPCKEFIRSTVEQPAKNFNMFCKECGAFYFSGIQRLLLGLYSCLEVNCGSRSEVAGSFSEKGL